jgi:hypothetical protein
MKFISYVASTMLIVLISQHSIMGLPLNHTVTGTLCSEGFKMINGQCIPIYSVTSTTEIETSSNPSENMLIHEEQSATELIIPKITGACPEGMEHGIHGICQEIQPSETTEVTDQSTTDLNEHVGGVEDIKGCPQGTQPDEQGACQETIPSISTKIATDPKLLLKQDGSCPDDYKMIGGRCLYVKPKTNSTLYPSGLQAAHHVSIVPRPKSVNDESSTAELVPVLPDNSCPEGTEYSAYGLCQKHTHLSNSNFHVTANGSCPDDFQLINGKCLYKNSKIQTKPIFTTTTSISETTTLAEEALNNNKLLESTTSIGGIN